MAGQLQEGAGEGLAGRRPQRGVAAAQLLLLGDGGQEAFGHIPLRGGADPGVLVDLAQGELVAQFLEPSIEAFEHLLGFPSDLTQLAIGESGQVGHIDLAVIPQGEESGPLPAAAAFSRAADVAKPGAGLLGTLGWNGTSGAAAAGDAAGGIEHVICGVWGCGVTSGPGG